MRKTKIPLHWEIARVVMTYLGFHLLFHHHLSRKKVKDFLGNIGLSTYENFIGYLMDKPEIVKLIKNRFKKVVN